MQSRGFTGEFPDVAWREALRRSESILALTVPRGPSASGRARAFAIGVSCLSSEVQGDDDNPRDGPPVRVEVRDGAAATEAFRELIGASAMPSPSTKGGRGLALVRALASRVGLDDDPGGGKVVWFEY